jgi:hypothetical protein
MTRTEEDPVPENRLEERELSAPVIAFEGIFGWAEEVHNRW